MCQAEMTDTMQMVKVVVVNEQNRDGCLKGKATSQAGCCDRLGD